MKCSDVRPLLKQLCDGTLSSNQCAQVLDHVRMCESCQAEWEALEALRVRERTMKAKTDLSGQFVVRGKQALKDGGKKRPELVPPQVRTYLIYFIAVGMMIAGLVMLVGRWTELR